MEKNSKSVWKALWFQVQLIKEEKLSIMYLNYLISPLVNGAIPVIMIVLPGFIIDSVVSGNLQEVYFYSLLFAGSVLISYVIFHICNSSISAQVLRLRFMANKRYNFKYRYVDYKYLEDPEFHAKRSTALSALRSSNEGLEGNYRNIYRLLTEVVSVVGLLLIIGVFNVWIVLIAVVLSIVQFYISLIAKKYRFKHRDDLNEKRRKAYYFFRIGHDFLFGKDIRVDQMDGELMKRYKEKSKDYTGLFKKIKEVEFRYGLFEVVFILVINLITYYLVMNAYFDGILTIGQLSMTIWAIIAVSVKLQTVFTVAASIKEESSYVAEFLHFLDNKSYFPVDNGSKPEFKEFHIEFQDVSFHYPRSEEWILRDLNLTIKAHEKLALVGINGAGKTTIVKLLCGFYAPTKGKVLINGIDLETINKAYYREQLGVVFQDVNIYPASVVENIVGEEVTEESRAKAVEALNLVGLKEKIDSYENKEDQQLLKIIEENGTDLSGGETQRLAISRALYKETTNCIILDEPTSALDALHEKSIYENFELLIQNKTAVFISHRLASTKFCDHIAYLEQGKITEYGTHDELMKMENGEYRNMFITQGKYYQKEGEINE